MPSSSMIRGGSIAVMIFSLIGCVSASAKSSVAPAAARGYSGHRVAVWAFEPDGRFAGFDQGQVKPGETLTLSPAKNYDVSYSISAPVVLDLLDNGVEKQAQGVPLKIVCRTTSLESSRTLDQLDPIVLWDTSAQRQEAKHVAGPSLTSVSFLAPIGGPLPEGVVPAAFTNTPAGLEDLLLDLVAQHRVSAGSVFEVYQAMKSASRQTRLRQMMLADDRANSAFAMSTLALFGDADATDRLCRLCLSTRGNEQVELVSLLPNLPRSPRLLETMVDLIVADRKYLTDLGPNIAVADVDRRGALMNAVATYPREQLRPHLPRLIQWAKKMHYAGFEKELEAMQ